MTRYRSHRYTEDWGEDEMNGLYRNGMDWSVFVQAERDEGTIELGTSLENVESVADMSAGGSRITPMIASHYGVIPYLGDYGDAYGYQFQGTLQQTVPALPPVDLFVCSETIEHLTNPDADLALIRDKARTLLLTTPIWEEPHMVSHGHLWTWRREDVEKMLADVGFTPLRFVEISIFGLWLFQ